MARFNDSASVAVKPAKSSANAQRSCSSPSSVLNAVDNILEVISNARHNKVHAEKFRETLKQIVKALNGVELHFVRHAEFYPDLKETLNKIYCHIIETTTRRKWAKMMMAKKDQKTAEEIQKHVDNLVSRIVFSYANRTKTKRSSPTPSRESAFGSDECLVFQMSSQPSCEMSENSFSSSEGELKLEAER